MSNPIINFDNLKIVDTPEKHQKFYIETYGCQMNVADSELVVSILQNSGFAYSAKMEDADLLLINTCSIRDNAEQRVFGRLDIFRLMKKKKPSVLIAVIGCMAERLKTQLLEVEYKVDIVIGPDAYRNLPLLIHQAEGGQKSINVLLSREETYADISPVRIGSNHVSAFISIMRGCDNMCSYCVVPFTRGRERTRDPQTILNEIKNLSIEGYKEITLLGQNVDKYFWEKDQYGFADLLKHAAEIDSSMRIRFSTSFPKDLTDRVIETMAAYPNICKSIHLPVQSGSNRILELMKRGYTREYFMQRVESIRKHIPDCAISTDIIAGFCSETEEDHQETMDLLRSVKTDFAYMFKYSERPNTYAQRNFPDDVPEEIKTRRLSEIIDLQNQLALVSNQNDIGKTFEVLVEGFSKKSKLNLFGRNSQNKVIVFPALNYKTGDYVHVMVESCSSATLKGKSV